MTRGVLCLSYYCEMCGRELDAKTAKKAVVEGSLLILCPVCYARISKREPVIRAQVTAIAKKTSPGYSTHSKKPARIAEEYEVVEDYASRIRAARESLGWSQDILAQKVGESVSTIKRIEAGKLKPSIELAKKLEKVLGIKLLEPVVREELLQHQGSAREEFLTIGDLISLKEEKRSS